MAADLLSNTAYFAGFLLGRPSVPSCARRRPAWAPAWPRSCFRPCCASGWRRDRTARKNRLFTIGLYLVGGLVAASAFHRSRARMRRRFFAFSRRPRSSAGPW